jgi:transcriptional regulator with XRE-family HTH domain
MRKFSAVVLPFRRSDAEGVMSRHPDTGAVLREARLNQGLTIARLASLSKVSRRHISLAESGGNITLDILKKLMGALHLRTISLGRMSATVAGEFLNPALILEAVDRFEAALAEAREAASRIRSVAESRTSSMNAKAAALVLEVATHVRALDPAALVDFEREIQSTLQTKKQQPRRSRKSA